MRLLLWLLVVLALVWLFRSSRRKADRHADTSHAQQQAGSETATMVACDICGVHIPLPEAVSGKRGRYCCMAHQLKAEG